MAERMILLNPGPVTLTERVRAALGRGDWCHREPEFAALVRSINTCLAAVYQEFAEEYESVLLTGSGTAAVEAMLASFAPEERTTLVIANGVYGERMARMLAAHRRPYRVLEHAWTDGVAIDALERTLVGDAGISHVAVVHHETTTGRLNDLEAIGRVCKARGIELLVDGVSSFGAEQLRGRDWNLAAVAGTANKCLHGVPGISFVLGHRSAWAAAATPGSVYLDLPAYRRMQHGDGFSPFTQAVQVAFALAEALAEHRESGGWLQRRALYRARATRVHQVLTGLGVTTLLAPADYSSVLWSYVLPQGRSYAGLHHALKAHGFVIYAGQGALSAQVFRLAHMGDIGEHDLERLCAALTAVIGER